MLICQGLGTIRYVGSNSQWQKEHSSCLRVIQGAMVCYTSKRPSVLAYIQLPSRLIQLSTTILRRKGLRPSVSIQTISMH